MKWVRGPALIQLRGLADLPCRKVLFSGRDRDEIDAGAAGRPGLRGELGFIAPPRLIGLRCEIPGDRLSFRSPVEIFDAPEILRKLTRQEEEATAGAADRAPPVTLEVWEMARPTTSSQTASSGAESHDRRRRRRQPRH